MKEQLKLKKILTKDGYEIFVEEYNKQQEEFYIYDMFKNFIDYFIFENNEEYNIYIKSIENDTLEENIDAWGTGRYTLTDTAEDMLRDITEDTTEETKEQVEESFKKGVSIWATESLINVVQNKMTKTKKFFYLNEY